VTIDILRKTGGWCVELQTPLSYRGKTIDSIEVRMSTANDTIRWLDGHIPSALALLSRLCDLPEPLLRQLVDRDFDRVMMALFNCVSSSVRTDLERGQKPMATPEEDLPEDQQGVPVNDQVDPRFPAVDGPVRRFKPTPQQEQDDAGMNLQPPDSVKAVNE
jgi:hypothetical protein